eukprot:15011625-Ditylum_brightwellii.AAC.1
MMKVIWNRQLVPAAVKSELVHLIQFGNKKGCMVLDALLLMVITMNTMQLIRLNGAILNNDAVACYNRMICEVTALHLQSLDLPDSTTKCIVQLN